MRETPAIIASGLPGNRVDAYRAGMTMTPATAADSISRSDRDLLTRLTIVLVCGFLFAAAFVHLNATYTHKFFDVTGHAQWIWPKGDLKAELPLGFFATRDFDLPANRYYTKIKIAGDPEYTLYFNGREIGARRMAADDHALDVYDVTALAKTGRNRIVIATRSEKGVGGLLAAVDIAPETENLVVTDERWKIARHWTPSLVTTDTARMERPISLGEPPVGRWNFLRPRETPLDQPPAFMKQPIAMWNFKGALSEVKEVNGVAVRGSRRVRAWAYDFGGFVNGRLRLTRSDQSMVVGNDVLDVRFANAKEELTSVEGSITPFTFAAGERTVVDPDTHSFRYVAVYERLATPEVLGR
jgi:hypothetical protein